MMMKTRYDVRTSKGFDFRMDDLREAFNMAKSFAKTDDLVTLTKIVWDENRCIVEHKVCRVFEDGRYVYFN